MKKLLFLILLTAIVIGALQGRFVARARAEHEALLKDSADIERLRSENAALAQLPAVDAEVQTLRQSQHELARLRNEMPQLREQAGNAMHLREVHQQLLQTQTNLLSGAPPAGFISRERLIDAGLSSPEAAIQTLFHAMCQGDVRRFYLCQGQGEYQGSPAAEADERGYLRAQSAELTGYFIVWTTITSPDEENIGIGAIPGGAVLPLHLTRQSGEWNVSAFH